MISMITQIIDVIVLLFTGIVSFLTSTLRIVLMIPEFLAFIFSLVALMPSFISVFIVAGVTASVLFLIIGRN